MIYYYRIVPIGEITRSITNDMFAAQLTTAWPQASTEQVNGSTESPIVRCHIAWETSATVESVGGHFYPQRQRLDILGNSHRWVEVVLWYRRIVPLEQRLLFHTEQESQLELHSTTRQQLLQLFLPTLTADAWELLALLQAMGYLTPELALVERLRGQWQTDDIESFIIRADSAFNQLWRLQYIASPGGRWMFESVKPQIVEFSIRPVVEHPEGANFQFLSVTTPGEQALYAKQELEK